MNIPESDFPVRGAAEAGVPRICADGPLFPLAWHARIFALVVAMVETGKLDWKDFQPRLVGYLSGHENENRHGDDVTAHYFEHWLEAAEDTLVDHGFLDPGEIPGQIERIRETVESIRAGQTGARSAI